MKLGDGGGGASDCIPKASERATNQNTEVTQKMKRLKDLVTFPIKNEPVAPEALR